MPSRYRRGLIGRWGGETYMTKGREDWLVTIALTLVFGGIAVVGLGPWQGGAVAVLIFMAVVLAREI